MPWLAAELLELARRVQEGAPDKRLLLMDVGSELELLIKVIESKLKEG